MNLNHCKQSNLINLASSISEKFQKQVIKVAIAVSLDSDINWASINFNENKEVEEADGYDLIGLYIKIIKWFMHYDKEEFKEKLLENGFTSNFIEKFPLKYESKAQINIYPNNSSNIQTLKWRIDLSLSNNVVKKKVPPWVIITLKLQNNKKHILIIDISTFHILRFNVALMMKQLINLKSLGSKKII